MSGIEAIGINLPGLITQFINFGLFLVLLIVFLYRPVVRMLDQRSERIRDALAQAEEARQASARSGDEVQKALAEARDRAQQIVQQAEEVGRRMGSDARDQARLEAEGIVQRARLDIQLERDDAIDQVRREFADLAIVAAERRRGRNYLYLWVEEARHSAAFGQGAAMAWSKVFNHADAAPRQTGGIDLRVEAAEALCEYGNSAPAEQLLAGNANILSLHLAILRGQSRRGETIDAERLDFVAQCTSAGLGDWRYSYPRALLGATRQEILALVTETVEAAPPSAPGKFEWEGGMMSRFMQTKISTLKFSVTIWFS